MIKRCLLLAIYCTVSSLSADGVINVWSGREVTLPLDIEGQWSLAAEHGRILAHGDGEVRLFLPELADHTSIEARLESGQAKYQVKIWSPKILPHGIRVEGDRLSKIFPAYDKKKNVTKILATEKADLSSEILSEYRKNYKFVLIFPSRNDFPVQLPGKVETIILEKTGTSGQLGVSVDRQERVLDNNGDLAYSVMKSDNLHIAFFSPEFDIDEIDNVLQIKKLIDQYGDEKGKPVENERPQ